MHLRIPTWAVAAATSVLLLACQDSSTSPRQAANEPRFGTASDTGGGGGGGTQVFHFVSNGDNGYVDWYTFTGDSLGGFRVSSGVVGAGRGGSTNNPQVAMSYYVYEYGCDAAWNCFYNLLSAGWGVIPAKDLTLSGKRLRLNTNTANNPNFYVYAGVAGPVSITWLADGVLQNTFSGVWSARYGNLIHRSQGSSTSWSAVASGSVVGIPIGPTPGNFGTNHNVSIDIYR